MRKWILDSRLHTEAKCNLVRCAFCSNADSRGTTLPNGIGFPDGGWRVHVSVSRVMRGLVVHHKARDEPAQGVVDGRAAAQLLVALAQLGDALARLVLRGERPVGERHDEPEDRHGDDHLGEREAAVEAWRRALSGDRESITPAVIEGKVRDAQDGRE